MVAMDAIDAVLNWDLGLLELLGAEMHRQAGRRSFATGLPALRGRLVFLRFWGRPFRTDDMGGSRA